MAVWMLLLSVFRLQRIMVMPSCCVLVGEVDTTGSGASDNAVSVVKVASRCDKEKVVVTDHQPPLKNNCLYATMVGLVSDWK